MKLMTVLSDYISPSEMDEFTLSSAELSLLLRHVRLAPWPGSPLRHLRPPAGDVPEPDWMPAQDLIEAVGRIASPQVVIGTLSHPPDDPSYLWFYGEHGNMGFALHMEDEGGEHHIGWPVTATNVLDIIESPLALEQPSMREGVSLTLRANEFQTLVAIMDIIQEEELMAFLRRTRTISPRFNASALLECHHRNLRGNDLRWMGQRVRLFSPAEFVPSLENLNSGLESLRHKGMLRIEDGHYTPTAQIQSIHAPLSVCSGLSALCTRRRIVQSDGRAIWELGHVAAMRGLGSLWLLEFSEIEASDFVVRIHDSSPDFVRETLQAKVLSKGKPSPPTSQPRERAEARARPLPSPPGPVAPAPHAGAGEVQCQNCGAKLSPNNKFCTQCGAPIAKKP